MPKQTMILVKAILHLALLAPFVWLFQIFRNGSLALDADPVNYVTHFTGNWALWILLGSLAITPVRRLSTKLGFLIRFRRLIGLYAFFYATLHLATYVFLCSGFDLPAAMHGATGGHFGGFVSQWRLVWPTIWDDLRKRRFIQVGLFSWFILFALAITTPAGIMRRIGGKPWQRLHRLVYVAGVAAVIHFWWLVKSGVRTPIRVTLILFILLLARLALAFAKKHMTSSGPPASSSA